MIRHGTPRAPTLVACPRCHQPRVAVQLASAACCALVVCRCDYGEPRVLLVEGPDCRGCVASRVAWRAHLARERRRDTRPA